MWGLIRPLVFSFLNVNELCSGVFRYGFLLPDNHTNQDPLSSSVAILQQFGILPEMYQVGFTKLFFRAGQVNWMIFFGFSFVSTFTIRCHVENFWKRSNLMSLYQYPILMSYRLVHWKK